MNSVINELIPDIVSITTVKAMFACDLETANSIAKQSKATVDCKGYPYYSVSRLRTFFWERYTKQSGRPLTWFDFESKMDIRLKGLDVYSIMLYFHMKCKQLAQNKSTFEYSSTQYTKEAHVSSGTFQNAKEKLIAHGLITQQKELRRGTIVNLYSIPENDKNDTRRDMNVFIRTQFFDDCEQRARALRITFSGVAKLSDLPQKKGIEAYKRNYIRTAREKGYDESLPYSEIQEEYFDRYCRAFMISDREAYIIPEEGIKRLSAPEPQKEPEQNLRLESYDELLSVLEELTQEMKTHRHEMIKLRDALKAFGESTTLTKVAKNTEETNMKLLTTNRALDAIDNKVNMLVTHGQKVEQKLDKGNNAALETANKLKAVVEGVSGLLSKVTKICALYDRR